MATPTIPNGKDYFNSVLYTGTGSDNAVTGVGFAPDATWLKRRDSGDADWGAYDTTRGATKAFKLNKNEAESTESNGLKVFGTDGFTVGSSGDANASGGNFVSYNWLVNGGTTVTNDASATGIGDIDSSYQVNTTSGFSIVTYTGTGSAGGIAHGLGKTPRWVMVSALTNTSDGFAVLHGSTTTSFYDLSKTNDENTATGVWNAVPTSTIFNVGTASGTNSSGLNYIAYCWAEIDGFSKFGAYSGSSSLPFIYTGFKPSWIMFKERGNNNNWPIWDSARETINPTNNCLFADDPQGENGSSLDIDVLSNGFKLRTTNSNMNRSTGTYIYFAFAEHPFVGDGVSPVTAR